MKRTMLALAAAATLVLGACGGDDGGDGSSSTTAAASGASTSEAESSATTAESTTATSATSAAVGSTASSTGGAAAATPLALSEWKVDAPATYTAGPVTFDVSNRGQAPHELLVIKGTYGSLPQSDIGAVLEEQLDAGAVLGETERLEPGSTAELTVDFAAGNYTLLCNIAVGPNSHAGKGQVLDVTVT